MQNTGLWKYCTDEQCKDMLLPFQLLGKTGWSDDRILACLYAVSNHAETHYRPVSIRKKDGTDRRLYVPDPLLMKIQKNILHHILDSITVSSYATAYYKGAGIKDNASIHVNKSRILKLDLKDFFGNILYFMVTQRVFSSLYFPPSVGTMLTSLCCYKECLPQGAPTSPAISNLVMKPFDEYMGQWCGERGIAYTRYCDDMTFSGEFQVNMVKNKVNSYLHAMGFTLNDAKTKVLPQSFRQSVTGIVVNCKPQVSKEYRKKLRQEIYYCSRYGAASHLSYCKDRKFLPKGQEGIRRYLLTLSGKINFILQVNPHDTYFLKAREGIRKLMLLNEEDVE